MLWAWVGWPLLFLLFFPLSGFIFIWWFLFWQWRWKKEEKEEKEEEKGGLKKWLLRTCRADITFVQDVTFPFWISSYTYRSPSTKKKSCFSFLNKFFCIFLSGFILLIWWFIFWQWRWKEEEEKKEKEKGLNFENVSRFLRVSESGAFGHWKHIYYDFKVHFLALLRSSLG